MNIFLFYSLLLLELILLFSIVVYLLGLIFSALHGAPYVPTSRKKLHEIFDFISIKPKSVFMELGSGDGRIVRYAVKHFNVHGVGIEINPLLVILSRILAKRDRLTSIQFLKRSIFDVDLSSADYLYLFLMPELIVKLLPKFNKELKKNAIIISHGFKIVGWEKKLWKTLPAKTFSTFYYKI